MVKVEWYASFPELIRGLSRSAFAGVEYSVVLALLLGLAGPFFLVGPWIGALVTTGAARWLCGFAAFLYTLAFCDSAHFRGGREWEGITYPFGALTLTFVLWRSMVQTLWRGGIEWRGTHYDLSELRRNRV
jgi:hypothetical protein